MFCSNCGKQLPDNAKFCNGCGAQQQVQSAVPQQSAPPVLPVYEEPVKPVKAKKKFPIWVVIVALVLVVAIVAALVLPGLDLGGGTASGGKNKGKDKDEDDDDKSSSGGKSMYALTEVTMYSYGELDVHVLLTYDSDGRLVQVFNEDGYGDYLQLVFTYNEQGYVSEKNVTSSYGDNYTVEFEYDMEYGRMTASQVTFADGSETETEYFYEDGVLVEEDVNQDGSYHVVLGYDNDGYCQYTYTDEGLVERLDLYNAYYGENMYYYFEYNANGKMDFAEYGEEDNYTYSFEWNYDKDGNLMEDDSGLIYSFDNSGNLTRIELEEDDSCYIEFTYARLSPNKHNRLANEFVKNLALGEYLEMPLFNSPYMLYFYDLFQEME